MSAAWMLQAALAAALLGVGALAAERVAGWFGAPRRAVWAAAMLGSLGLAALSLAAPRFLPAPGVLRIPAPAVHLPEAAPAPLDLAAPLAATRTPAAATASAASADSPAWWTDLRVPLSLAWLAASLAMLGVVGWTYRRLRKVCERGLRAELEGVEVRVVEGVGPCVVGLAHPEVVVPRWVLDVAAEERRLVLLHEREHVAAGDAWLLFLGTLAVAAMPWCPALWWQHRRLRAAVEADCDARVLARGAARRVYGQVLIRTAGSTPGLPLLGPAWGDSTSQLERRIIDMTAKRPTHRLLRSAPLLALAAAVATTACDVLAGAEAQASISTDPAAVRVAVEARLGVAAPERVVDTVPLPRALAPLPPMEPAAFPPLPALEAAAPLPPQDPPAPARAVLPALAAPPAPESQPAPEPELAPAAPPVAEAPAVRPPPPVLMAPAIAPTPEAPP
ncbi:MAG TPA: M56 family metallopeptidase, partial [Longimicrobiaceae bacterium]